MLEVLQIKKQLMDFYTEKEFDCKPLAGLIEEVETLKKNEFAEKLEQIPEGLWFWKYCLIKLWLLIHEGSEEL